MNFKEYVQSTSLNEGIMSKGNANNVVQKNYEMKTLGKEAVDSKGRPIRDSLVMDLDDSYLIYAVKDGASGFTLYEFDNGDSNRIYLQRDMLSKLKTL